MSGFPMYMKLEGKNCLVVGGGIVALRKIRALYEFGADITVISDKLCPELMVMEIAGEIISIKCNGEDTLQRVKSELGTSKPYFTGICATSDETLNSSAAQLFKTAGCLVNSATSKDDCDFYFPSVIRRGEMCLGISTGSAAPSISRYLRCRLEETLPVWTEKWICNVETARKFVKENVPDIRKRKELMERLTDIAYKRRGNLSEEFILSWIERVNREN